MERSEERKADLCGRYVDGKGGIGQLGSDFQVQLPKRVSNE
jgi:hypothetical protein